MRDGHNARNDAYEDRVMRTFKDGQGHYGLNACAALYVNLGGTHRFGLSNGL